MCDVRLVWGGDATIAELRKSALRPRATEITFADRYSLAVINSDEYMASEDKHRVALDFYNDTYLTDQNACTSPRVVVWVGTCKAEARKIFWDKLTDIVEKKYRFQPVMAVDKLVQAYLAAMDAERIGVISRVSDDNLIVRESVERLTPKLMDYRGNCGYFYEYECDDVMNLREFCDDTHCQSVGVIGDSTGMRFLIESGIRGIDRVVPIGHMMDFNLNWDGYNLVERMTRTVII
jgi:hypothetical protein